MNFNSPVYFHNMPKTMHAWYEKKTGQVEQPVICRVLNVQTPPPNTVLTSCWQFWRMLKTFNQLWTSLMKEDTERSQEKDKTRIRKEVKTWLIQNKESYIWCLIDGCCIIVTIRWPHIMLSAMVIFFSADKDIDRFSASLAFTLLQKRKMQWTAMVIFLLTKTMLPLFG